MRGGFLLGRCRGRGTKRRAVSEEMLVEVEGIVEGIGAGEFRMYQEVKRGLNRETKASKVVTDKYRVA
jgi:hypothetical protein